RKEKSTTSDRFLIKTGRSAAAADRHRRAARGSNERSRTRARSHAPEAGLHSSRAPKGLSRCSTIKDFISSDSLPHTLGARGSSGRVVRRESARFAFRTSGKMVEADALLRHVSFAQGQES